MTQIHRLFYLLFVLTFAFLVSCNEDDDEVSPEARIAGTWRITDNIYTFNDLSIRDFYEQYGNDNGEPFTDEELDAIEESVLQLFTEPFDNGTTFEFQSEGTVIIDSPNDVNDGQANWDIRNDETLVISDDSSTLEFAITNLTNSELRLLFEDEETFDPGLGTEETITIGLTLVFAKQ